MERRLDTPVDLVKDAGVPGLFIPGNHDWEKEGDGGWDAVRREGARVTARGGPAVAFLPKDGCPGPEVLDLEEQVRLVALDTQWWLHSGRKPSDPTSGCGAYSESGVIEALRHALSSAGVRQVVVVGHHPLATGGPHGGHFSFRQHVFPLTEVNRGLWIPLPIIGSAYPLVRKRGAAPQDIASERNGHMREALEDAFRERPPLVYASGHEHALQVLGGRSVRNLLVNGAGIYGHTSRVWRIPGSRFASSGPGFMRLDFAATGTRLAVLAVDARGSLTEVYAEWLRLAP
jgi:hypothetical protein